jgi:serine/threonine protein phosphatase PrpC
MDERDMARALEQAGANLEAAVDRLIALANDRGGDDNATAIVIRAGAG